MPKLPINFSWKESPAHIDLLGAFSKPHDVNHILTWQTIRQTLGESTEDAISRFINQRMLIPATLNESLGTVLQVAQLKDLLKERNLKLSGSKSELVARLIETDRGSVETLLKKNKVMKCSETAQAFLDERKNAKEREFELAQKQSFEFLKMGKPKDAYRAYAEYQKKYTPYFESSSYQVGELQAVLMSFPRVLGNMSPENKKWLQAAAGMKLLWRDEKAEYWLPEDFLIPIGNSKRAINYLLKNAEFRKYISETDKFTKKIKISFDSGDIDSCPLCLSLDGKILDVDKVPELPMAGCSSETGCMCQFEYQYDNEDIDDEASFLDSDETISEAFEIHPVRRMKYLIELLDEGLITQEEFDKKKKEILENL